MRPVAVLFVLTMVAGTASVGSAEGGGTSSREPGVAPQVVQLGLSEADLRAVPSAAGVLLSPEREAGPFSLVALTWTAGSALLSELSVRTRSQSAWGEWTHLDPDSDGPDAGTSEALGLPGEGPRDSTVALWTGNSDAFQVRAQTTEPGRAPTLPTDLRLVLIDPGHAPSDAVADDPLAFTPAAVTTDTWPRIKTREDWGADERLRERPKYTGPVRAAFVHHTAGTNRYDRSDVPRILRAIYAFHVKGRGWADIGYNFLVDRWGRVWEGRAGGVGLPVRGAHTGGFNVDSFGVAAIGAFRDRKPPRPMLESIARVIRWKFDRPDDGLDPFSWTRLTSTGGGTSRYKEGKEVSFRRISGHRDAGRTACPGEQLYEALPKLRTRVAELQGSGTVEFGSGESLAGTGEPAQRPAPAPVAPQQPAAPPPAPRATQAPPQAPPPPRSPLQPIFRPRPPAPPPFPWQRPRSDPAPAPERAGVSRASGG